MRTIISKTLSNGSGPIYPKKSNHFQWMTLKKSDPKKPNKFPKNHNSNYDEEETEEEEEEEILAFSISSSFNDNLLPTPTQTPFSNSSRQVSKKKTPSQFAGDTMLKIRSTLLAINNRIRNKQGGLGPCVIGTIFGRRRGRVHISFQIDPKSPPVLLVELETQTSTLVREMASGLVRIALECQQSTPGQDSRRKLTSSATSATRKLLDEPIWRAYCNGKKCGYATHKECGPLDWRLFKAVEPVSVGAGVLPSEKDENGENGESELGDVMYMRARFERVVGSKDSEAFYMLNPDGNGGPELSIYLLRV